MTRRAFEFACVVIALVLYCRTQEGYNKQCNIEFSENKIALHEGNDVVMDKTLRDNFA